MIAVRTRLLITLAAVALVAACSGTSSIDSPCGIGFPCSGRRSIAQIQLAPFPPTLSVGDTATIIAAALDSTGTQISGVIFQYSSSNPLVATVDDTGLVTAVVLGSTTLSAAAGGQAASVQLFVR